MKKVSKTIALFLALAMMLSMSALAAGKKQDKEEKNESRLWTRWVEWDEEDHLFVASDWYDGGQMCHPGEERYWVFYTAEKWNDEDQPVKPQPVKAKDLVASDGVTLTPMKDNAEKGDSLADCYVKVTVDEFDKEYTVSNGGQDFPIFSHLPDISLYDAPERTTEHYVVDNQFVYTPSCMEYYVIAENDMEKYGRVMESLTLSKNSKDTINDMVTLEKVSDEIYRVSLKDGANPAAVEKEHRVRFTITWLEQDGNTWDDDSYEIWVWDRPTVVAGESAVLDGTKDFPNWDEKPYTDVADKLSTTVTMSAGEAKTVYLNVAMLDYPEDQEPDWIVAARSSAMYISSDAALTLTGDSVDGTKVTLSCAQPGEYEIAVTPVHYYYLDENGDVIPEGSDEEAAIEEELTELWGDEWYVSTAMNGKEMIFWDFANDVKLECPYDIVMAKGTWDERNDYILSLKVIVEDATPISERFSDVAEGQWYVEAVKFVSGKGMMNGNDGKFNPNGSITGAEFVQIMYNIAGNPAPAAGAAFAGVNASDWYAPAVLWAAGEGLISDTGAAALNPTAPLTREQMFVILYNMVGGDEKAEADLSVFTDAGEVSSWAADAVNWAVSNHVTDGIGDNKFGPADATNRAGVAAMLMKYYQ